MRVHSPLGNKPIGRPILRGLLRGLGIDLALFVHRVEGYAPGLYYLARDPERVPAARAALSSHGATVAATRSGV